MVGRPHKSANARLSPTRRDGIHHIFPCSRWTRDVCRRKLRSYTGVSNPVNFAICQGEVTGVECRPTPMNGAPPYSEELRVEASLHHVVISV
jgi:hypothetical protein